MITNSEKLCNDPNIHWYQHVDEEKLIRLYQRSVALLYPSLYEGFGQALLEASGGVTLKTVRSIAETGVDAISIGGLTHSSPAIDMSLEL